MKFFLDTGNVDEIRKAVAWGQVDGVTTNPSLVAKEGRDFKQLVLEICSLTDGPVSAEVIALDYEGMMKEAREYATWAPNVIIKLPMTPEGLRAVKTCAEEGLKTNVTLLFEGEQRLFSTQGDDKCTVDTLSQQRVETLGEKRAIYRVVARGFCLGPATSLSRGERVFLTSFDFAGRVEFGDDDRHAHAQ